MTRPRKICTACCLLATGAAFLVSCAEQESAPRAYVDDRAAMLTTAEEASISRSHAALLEQYDIDYRVLTVPKAPDLSALAVDQFAERRIGSLSRAKRGLLLVVDAEEQRVRLEVSRELEGEFVDSFVAFVENEQMAPFFAAGRVGDGILATTELIVTRAEEAITASSPRQDGGEASSAGAGAEVSAPVHSGYQRPAARATTDTDAAATPLDSVGACLAVMAAHDARPDLDLYTPATRVMLADHVVTRAQMDNLVRAYGECPAPRVREQEGFAVVDHPGEGGTCAPWFLARGADGNWRVDLVVMQRAVRFDSRNRWRVADPTSLGSYAFAFRN